MAAYDNLLFIGASHQCFHQPPLSLRPHEAAAATNRAASCQTLHHRHKNATHTGTEYTSYILMFIYTHVNLFEGLIYLK